MTTIYVVTIETGEYSDWDQGYASYFLTETEANKYVEFRRTISEICREEKLFNVEPIPIDCDIQALSEPATVYIVVKEVGEYSDRTIIIESCFINEEDANNHKQQRKADAKLQPQTEVVYYSVEEIERGQLPHNMDEVIAATRDERKKYDEEMEENQKRMQATVDENNRKYRAKQTATIHACLDEWHTLSTSQKDAMRTQLLTKLPTLMKESQDVEAMNRARAWIQTEDMEAIKRYQSSTVNIPQKN
jgi:hypothetical protein